MHDSEELPRYRLSYPATGIGVSGRCLWEGRSVDGRLVQHERGYRFVDVSFRRAFFTQIPPDLRDLMDVALAVYIADRLSPRHAGRWRGGRGWQRILEVDLPVRDPSRWQSTPVVRGLERLLGYFTEDRWCFRFSQRQQDPQEPAVQQVSFPIPFDGEPVVGLFSGGLDSLAGAARQLLTNGDCQLFGVAGATSNWSSSIQRRLFASLARRFRDRVVPVIVPFQLALAKGSRYREEATQRSRGFIHLMLGAVAAILAETNILFVYENGVGALNLRYTGSQFGTHMTRAMHPLALAETAAWLSAYLGHPFRIIAPVIGLTKAQACAALHDADLGFLVSWTFSCDGFQRVAGRPQCGVCTSCLLRRQALFASGLADFDNPRRYRFDVTNPNAVIPTRHLAGLRLMLDQRAVLHRCVSAPDAWGALVEAFPELEEVEDRCEDWNKVGGPQSPSVTLPALYRSYVQEWESFPICSPWDHGPDSMIAA